MKKILIYLTLALCLCSLFAVSVFATDLVSITTSSSYSDPTVLPNGNYWLQVYVNDKLSVSQSLTVNYEEGTESWHDISVPYNGVDYMLTLRLSSNGIEGLIEDINTFVPFDATARIVISTEEPLPSEGTILDGVFSVFSNIGTYIANAFSGLVGLFWTGDQLTFLGILGVAGLCVGIVILFVGLISNFLHFRG